MNIGERFYCSRCLNELKKEGICSECHYNPMQESYANALEEGTLLNHGRYQIGAVRQVCNVGFIYGAYDYEKQQPVFIFEFYPASLCSRSHTDGVSVLTFPLKKVKFITTKRRLEKALEAFYNIWTENNTFFLTE